MAHGFRHFPCLEQSAHRHGRGDECHAPFDAYRLKTQKQGDDFWGVVKPPGETHQAGARKVRNIERGLGADAEYIPGVMLNTIGLIINPGIQDIHPIHGKGRDGGENGGRLNRLASPYARLASTGINSADWPGSGTNWPEIYLRNRCLHRPFP